MQEIQLLAAAAGRILMGGIFAYCAVMDTQQRQMLIDLLKSKNVPFATFLFFGAVALKFIGGLALALNFYTPIAALLLAGFTFIATIILHDFWRQTGQTRDFELVMFLIHMAIVGGFLALI